ncbi:hypothetical protein CR513_39382, partial [Mucuna pruriens]
MFTSFYHLDKIETRRTKIPCNVDSYESSPSTPPISIFNYPGRPGGKAITYFLDQVDLEAAHLYLYVLLNCEHVEPYLDIYTEFLRELNLLALDAEIDTHLSEGMNSTKHSVYVQGTNDQLEYDFYENLFDIIQLEYIILFKCDWFDNTPNIGTKVHNKYEIVEVRATRRYNKAYDPFIFAQQAEQ